MTVLWHVLALAVCFGIAANAMVLAMAFDRELHRAWQRATSFLHRRIL